MKVTNQKELDAAIANSRVREIIIDAPEGVWLTIDTSGRATPPAIDLRGSSHATLRGSSHADLWESSHATLWGSSHATLRGSSHADLWGSSHADLWESSHATLRGSSHATLRGSSHATLWESSHATLRGSSHATLRGSSHADLWESSHATLRGSSHATLRGSSHATLWESSHATATKYCAIHLFSKKATVEGGVVIDVTDIDTNRVPDFIDYYGVPVVDGWATVYKAVDGDLNSGRGFAYPIGETVTAPDWVPIQGCGQGLHFGFAPISAKSYFEAATRFLECHVRVSGLVALGDKVKAQSCKVVREVDIHGDAL